LSEVSRRGFGKVGYCKLCAWSEEPSLNKLMKAGKNAAECRQWAKDKFGFTFNRQTFYAHKEHITAPEDKVVAFADRQSRGLQPVIKRSTNKDFLEAVRDIGMAHAEADPELVTIDHALKAAQILEQSKSKQSDITLILAQVVTGHAPDVIVEGEAREVEPISE
jgi:hypothetical protein